MITKIVKEGLVSVSKEEAWRIVPKQNILFKPLPNSVTYSQHDMLEAPPETFTDTATIEDARIVLDGMMLESSLTEEEITAIADMYPAWAVGVDLAKDKIVSYLKVLYRVIQAHKTQADWTPDKVPALFTKCVPASVIAEWKQPIGATDAYKLKALVTYTGWIWECTGADANGNNVWAPGVYGWTKVRLV